MQRTLCFHVFFTLGEQSGGEEELLKVFAGVLHQCV